MPAPGPAPVPGPRDEEIVVDDNEDESFPDLDNLVDRPNFMDYFKTVDVTSAALLERVQNRKKARGDVMKAVNKKFRDKGLDVTMTDGNSVIQLAVDYVVSASRSLKQKHLRTVVHEMIHLYMETHDCLITRKGIQTFRDHVNKRSSTLKAEDLNAYFDKGFLVKYRSK